MSKICRSEKLVDHQTLVVKVDVSNDKHTGYFRCPKGCDMKPFSFGKTS